MALHYYKCNDCLSPMTTVEQMDVANSKCFCGGDIEYMGEVTHEERVVETRHQAKCDERCTNASGPICVCHCHNENHGKGLLASIEYTVDHGKAILTPIKVDVALQTATEYRKAVADAKQRMEDWLATKTNQNQRWPRYEAESKIKKASSWKRHALRMQRLNELIFGA